jgi:hypothetical protein
VFVDAGDWAATVEDSTRLLDALDDEELMPVPVPRTEGEDSGMRMGFFSEDGGKRVVISKNRIDYEWHGVFYEEANLGSLEDFCAQASSSLHAVMSSLGRRGQQLGLFQEGFLCGGPRYDMRGIAARLFHYPPTFELHPPIDWDYRLAARIERVFGPCSQEINTLVSLKRRRVGLLEDEAEERHENDQIIVYLETNTGSEALQARFAGSDMRAFFAEAPSWHRDLGLEMERFLEIA